MKKILVLVHLFLFCGLVVNAHPFYVSICQVDYNAKNHTLEISLKTFADDLLLALKEQGATKIYLGEERENPKTDELIFNYIKSQLKFRINNRDVKYSFIGKEMDSDVVWTYLEIENIAEFNKIEVECKLLTEIFESQNNIIQVNRNGEIKNLLLTKKRTYDSISY